MLAIAIATLLLGPGDFALARAEITTLNEMRALDPNIRRTIDLVASREGTPVLQAKIPPLELDKANIELDNVLLPSVRPALGARKWVGNRTQDFENETVDLTWRFQGQPILWTDFEGSSAVMLRNPADIPLIRSEEDAKEILPGLMAKLLDLPKDIPAYRFYIKKLELPSGGAALAGYASLLKSEQNGFGVPADVPQEKQWGVSIQVTIAERLVILRFSHPMSGQGGGQLGRPTNYKRPHSRFNPY